MPTSIDRPATDGDDASIKFIYPEIRHPYYIVSPPYTRLSAGVRALHLLCHSLNTTGHVARMVIYPTFPWRDDHVSPDLATPLLNCELLRLHFERGLVPIIVYPEVFSGNPLGGSCVVRYVLNYPGLLGGDKEYAPEEMCFAYSLSLARQTRFPDNVLYMPTVDTRVFHPPAVEGKRQGSCFYAHKYRAIHKGELFPCTNDSIEITREMDPQTIASIFYRSELFYTYENTALATEAVLCGCPAVFLPSPNLTAIIGNEDGRPYGFAWGDEPDEIARAKATVHLAKRDILSGFATYWRQLDRFIALTQEHAASKVYERRIEVPNDCSIDIPLKPEFIRELAREIWYERRRQGLPYKVAKWVKSRIASRKYPAK